MTINTKCLNNQTIMEIEGRVDANTSPILQEKLLLCFQANNGIILDFDKVEYVSSAGLRALLIGQKTAVSKGGSLKLINVTQMVMSVFEMSGFAGILSIEKSNK